jgi:hypothetical protein
MTFLIASLLVLLINTFIFRHGFEGTFLLWIHAWFKFSDFSKNSWTVLLKNIFYVYFYATALFQHDLF